MNKCVNLESFQSIENVYIKRDIEHFCKLKRLWSHNDVYENDGSCFLEDIFKNNKL